MADNKGLFISLLVYNAIVKEQGFPIIEKVKPDPDLSRKLQEAGAAFIEAEKKILVIGLKKSN
jgi:hypothetical protein